MRHAVRPTGRAVVCLALVSALVTTAEAATPVTWSSRGPGGGGAFFSPSFNPNDGSELYVASDMGDVFHTTDLAHWSTIDFHQLVGGRPVRVSFTSDARVLYAINNARDLTTPSKSTDGGLTWHALASDPTGGHAYALYADPARSDRLVVSDYGNFYFSNDAGATFRRIYSSPAGQGAFLAGAFFSGKRIFIGTNGGIVASTDNGATFSLQASAGIPAGNALVSFTGAKAGSVTRFFAVAAPAADVFPGMYVSSLWADATLVLTFDWGQSSWRTVTAGIPSTSHIGHVASAQFNIKVAYAAGQSDNYDYPVIYRTSDAGATWTAVLGTENNSNVYTGWFGQHGDSDWGYGGGPRGFTVSPFDVQRIAYTDDGFVHVSTDGGATWRQAYDSLYDENPPGAFTPKYRSYHGAGLEDTSWWHLTWSDANNVFASCTDIKGTRSVDGGESWSFDYTGHTSNTMYHALVHPNGKLYGATSTIHDLYESTFLADAQIDAGAHGYVLVSSDKGKTWSSLHDFAHPVVWLASDPNNSAKLYASVAHSTLGGVYVSSDIASGALSTWTRLAAPPRTQGHPYTIVVLKDGTLVASYSGRRDSTGAFTASSGVFILPPGASSWTDRTDAGMKYWTKDLVVSPSDTTQNTWYAGVFSGWGGPPNGLGGLYRTTNRGVSWTRISALDRVESIAINPNDPNEAYVTTEVDGLWHTTNLTAAAPTFTADPNYPFLHPTRVFWNPYDAKEIWVTSFGGGVRVGYTTAVFSDSDGVDDASDCAPGDAALWAAPGPPTSLTVKRSGGSLSLAWRAPDVPGTTRALTYDVIRSASPRDLTNGVTPVVCNGTALSATEAVPAGSVFFYVVRAKNGCGWNASTSSDGTPRVAKPCS